MEKIISIHTEKLPEGVYLATSEEEKDKRQVIQTLDTFIENNRLKRQAMEG